MDVRLANAPVSYGAFEITVGRLPNVPDPVDVLDAVATAGYTGIDLGPPGYLGTPDTLRERLSSRGLSLAGAFMPLAFSEPARLAAEIALVDEMLDLFDMVAPHAVEPFVPKLTLCDAGSPERVANPGRGQRDPSLSLGPEGWRRLADGVRQVVRRCRDHGYEPAFHHHVSTFVEGPSEIERLLDMTDVSLCLDTGHLIASDGDPVAALRDWGGRINHVHLKDASRDAIPADRTNASPPEDLWSPRTWRTLGDGELDVRGFLDGLRSIGYRGWIVVEQDHIPDPRVHLSEVTARQVRNKRVLADHGIS